jgi:uncharacterized repeat protein (TIGR03803 family)
MRKPQTPIVTILALMLTAIATPSANAQFTLDVLHNFAGGTDGNHPQGGVIQDADGNFYGTTAFGGTNCQDQGCGTIYKIDKNGEYTVLYRFSGGSDGAAPRAGVVRDAAGNLYGTTQGQGGVGAPSTLFKLDKSGQETTLFDFTDSKESGAADSTPILDAEGNLYGALSIGGDIHCQIGRNDVGCGLVYKLDATGTYRVIHTFKKFADGAQPEGGLVMDAAGNLYGSTVGGGVGADSKALLCSYLGIGGIGCGTVFKIDKNGKFTLLYCFHGKADGANPVGVTLDGAGNLYGVTDNGGALPCDVIFIYGCGTIFKIDMAGKFSVLHTFRPKPVSNSLYNNLFLDSKGNIYGTNEEDPFSAGFLFELDTKGKYRVLYTFSNASDGLSLTGAMLAPNGDFYGTLGTGGGAPDCGFDSAGCGTVFKLTP